MALYSYIALRRQFIRINVIHASEFCNSAKEDEEKFKVLNLRGSSFTRRKMERKKLEALPPRTNQMPVDQDWTNVWPGPRSFHPASVPLPIRQGYVNPLKKHLVTPGKFGNLELMKIPNFLHLTPPAITKHCQALKKFCQPWPKGIETEEKWRKHFPVEVYSSDYCYSAPTIRNPLARIVTIKFELSCLQLDSHARDKFLRLVGKRYNHKTDVVTLVAERCPIKKQNYDYAQYLLTALFFESWKTEDWEKDKQLVDMEVYEWKNNPSFQSFKYVCSHHQGRQNEEDVSSLPYAHEFEEAVSEIINKGESAYSINKYKEVVKQILNLNNEKRKDDVQAVSSSG